MKTKGHEPRSSSSCAACKLLKRRCTPNCIFAPHFRADEPNKFAKVHKVFGASNVSKILNEVPEEHREDTVNSLMYEAEARLCDPVYGCIGPIAMLQRRMVELQHDLALARANLARYNAYQSSNSNNSSNNNVASHSFGVLQHNDAFSATSSGTSGGAIDGILSCGHVHNVSVCNRLGSDLSQGESISTQFSQTNNNNSHNNNNQNNNNNNNNNSGDDCDFGHVPILPL